MTCTRCGSDSLSRSRRRGLGDHLRALLGSWPYRCERCDLRFWASERRHAVKPGNTHSTVREAPNYAESGAAFRAYSDAAAKAQSGGPGMAFRTHEEKPQAKIVLQADSHEQLNHILLALNRAVLSYQPEAQRQGERETAGTKR